MRIMLTSFGLGHEYLPEIPYVPPVFRRLPPLNMRPGAGQFEPEYSLLVLCDKLILDKLSFERLRENTSPVFATMAKTVKLLHDEGFVQLEDYSSTLRDNANLLRAMTENDISSGRWELALKVSEVIWGNYVERAFPHGEQLEFSHLEPAPPEVQALTTHVAFSTHAGSAADSLGLVPGQEIVSRHTAKRLDSPIPHDPLAPHMSPGRNFWSEALSRLMQSPIDWEAVSESVSSRMQRKPPQPPISRDLISAYLMYVNANLILSNELDSALHDWEDHLPFYRQKFLGVGKRPPAAAQADAAHQLFDIALPHLSINDPHHLLRVLKHRRIDELRKLIDAASKGDVEFDADFASSVLRETYGIGRRVEKERRIVGYVTMPIGFIPLVGNFAQALVQEGAGTLLERRLKKPYRWFFMLSDLAQQPTKQARSKRSKAQPTD